MDKQEHPFSLFMSGTDYENGKLLLDDFECESPSLNYFSDACSIQLTISSLSCGQFITKIEGIYNKQVKFAGNGKKALLNSLSLILLVLACKQTKYYPHLLTLIKEQFFKPGVFSDYEPSKRNRVLGLCRNIEIQIISSGSICAFLENNADFLEGFEHILHKIVGSQQEQPSETLETIRKKFNIDCGQMELFNSKAQCWILGMQKKLYLFEEMSNFIIVSAGTSTDPNRTLNQSTIENRLESQRSVEEFGQQIIIEASEQSTPKFKDNQQSIRYRKKSHKNSFGGDFQITGYKQLVNLVNKSHIQTPSPEKAKNKKVFSLKFEIQEMSNLEIDDPIQIKQDQDSYPIISNEQGMNLAKQEIQMRGSHIEGHQSRFSSQRKQRKSKVERRKHITSSEIFQLANGLAKNDKTRGPKFQEQNSNSNQNSNTASECESKEKKITEEIKSKESGIQQNRNLVSTNSTKQNFKFSFSKKDCHKFIFKQIENEYRKKAEGPGLESKRKFSPPRLSLQEEPESLVSRAVKNLQYEGDWKKKDNKRSLFLEGAIVPIQEEVQSSQQEKTQQQSLPQSNQQRQKQLLNFQSYQENKSRIQSQQRSQSNEPNGNSGFNWNSGQLEQVIQLNGNKGYLNILKTKNRKFSYLTQPISISNNSLFGGNQQLRQSYIEQANETSPELVEHETNHHHSNYIHRQQNKNRVSRPTKIHKNSEAITESKHKRRFEQNPISFSQMIANVTGHEDSNFSGHSLKNNKRQVKAAICPNVTEFTKKNVMCYNEPEGWIRKEVIYYFDQEKRIGQKINSFGKPLRVPERYVINRTTVHQTERLTKNNSHNKILDINQRPVLLIEGSREKLMRENQNPINIWQKLYISPREGDLSNCSSWQNIWSQNLPVERFLQSPHNIRSTIDTSKNTHHRTENNCVPVKTPYFKKQTTNNMTYANVDRRYFPHQGQKLMKQQIRSPQISEKQLVLPGNACCSLSPAPTTRSNNTNINFLKQANSIQHYPATTCFVNEQTSFSLHSQQRQPSPTDKYHNYVPFVTSASPVAHPLNQQLRDQLGRNFQIKQEVKQQRKLKYSPELTNQSYAQEIGRKEGLNFQQNQTISYSPAHNWKANNYNTKHDYRRPGEENPEHLYTNKPAPQNQGRNVYFENHQMKMQQNNHFIPIQTGSYLYYQNEAVVAGKNGLIHPVPTAGHTQSKQGIIRAN